MRKIVFAGILSVVCALSPASAVTWYVDGSVSVSGNGQSWATAFQKIQEGIDAGADGDTVIVGKGTYLENIHFHGKNIVLTGTDPLDPAVVANTVIDGNQAGSVVTFSGTEDETCVLSGFTIRSGKYEFGGGICGGTSQKHARAAIRHNVISGNSAAGVLGAGGGLSRCDGIIENNAIAQNHAQNHGGGLYDCDGTLQGNTIGGNSAGNAGGALAYCGCEVAKNTITENTAPHGGGLYQCTGEVRGNTISGNSAEGKYGLNGMGGGLAYCAVRIRDNTIKDNAAGSGGGFYDCDGTIEDNVVEGNSACGGGSRDGYGGGLSGCDGAVRNNIIRNNVSSVAGGGMCDCQAAIENNFVSGNCTRRWGGGLHNCSKTIRNNVIVGNTADHEWLSAYGGGLYACGGLIENNTIVGNWADDGSGLNHCKGTIRNCIVWGNSGLPEDQITESNVPTYSCVGTWIVGGEGNIRFPPYFVDAKGGDFHLNLWSPCIDAGDPASAFFNEPAPNGERVNIGAYGNTREAAPTPPNVDADGLPDGWEVHAFGHLEEDGDSDPDGDGIRNLNEYHYGWDPTTKADAFVENLTTGEGYQTIQTALWESNDGDEVEVHPGTYLENIDFGVKNVILRSRNPYDDAVVANTVIDGDRRGPVMSLPSAGGGICVVAGFTIRNGNEGIRDGHAKVTVERNLITANSGSGVYNCSGLIQHNIISDNSGCGLSRCNGLIRHNTISGNTSDYCGGGLASCDGLIEFNRIMSNEAHGLWDPEPPIWMGGYGGGLADCKGTIQNNVISGNSADMYGGGLSDCNGIVQNNVIRGNSAPWGGGLDNCHGTIQNNVVFGNAADYGGGLWQCEGAIRNCIIWGNTAEISGNQLHACSPPLYSCVQNWAGAEEGNTAEDPLFLDPANGDYHLRHGSPCIDAGVNYYWFAWPQRDLDGNCRLAGSRVDMGCYEYESAIDSDGDLLSDGDESFNETDPERPDTDGDGLRDGLEFLRGSDPLAPTEPRTVHVPSEVTTIQASLCLAVTADEVIVAPGRHCENLQFCGVDLILRGWEPEDPKVVASTTLDGSSAGSVVSFTGKESQACLLSGFRVTGGWGLYGGGICGGMWEAHTRAGIRNCIIVGNEARRGGGIAFCDGIVEGNTMSRNSAEDGGAVFQTDGTIRNNTISANIATGQGGGLAFCGGLIENNEIYGNVAEDGGGLHGCSRIWRDGITTAGEILNNTICFNTAHKTGGGLSQCLGTIRNCIMWGNKAQDGLQQIHESENVAYCCIQGGTEEGEHILTDDPRFVAAPSGDFRLLPCSPCIDAGENYFLAFFQTDIAGMHRVMYGAKSFTVDMGAHEYHVNDLEFGPVAGQTTLTWSSLPYRAYSIFCSDDLMVWHLADDSVPSATIETTSWIDDGSKTGVPPSLVPRRFYRILENP